MNEDMIEGWNTLVKPDDDVYHLGDFCMGGSKPKKWLRRLNGNVHLIRGNHDPYVENQGFASVQDYKELKVKGYRSITMLHYPMMTWNRSHKGSWHLFGHVHGTLTVKHKSLCVKDKMSTDVGVDCHDYYPISLEQVDKIMRKHAEFLKEALRKQDTRGLSNKEIEFRKRMIEAL